jgi:hypothetical protein
LHKLGGCAFCQHGSQAWLGSAYSSCRHYCFSSLLLLLLLLLLCRQYAGTGALKSGFTRTGKRTLGGLIDDGVKSMTRYYLNNFKVSIEWGTSGLFVSFTQQDSAGRTSTGVCIISL